MLNAKLHGAFTAIHHIIQISSIQMSAYEKEFLKLSCFMGNVMLTINWEPGFLFIGELGQQSKRWNLSVTVFLVLH